MARMRTVKPSLRTSRVVARWRFEVRYFWVLLWGYLDDEGRGLDLPKAIAGDCYPLDDNITAATINKWLDIMATTKIEPGKEPPLCRYQIGTERYLHSLNWDEHQRPNRPSPSRIPPCPVHELLTEPFTESVSEAAAAPRAAFVEQPDTDRQRGRGRKRDLDSKTNAGKTVKRDLERNFSVETQPETPVFSTSPQVSDVRLSEAPLSPHTLELEGLRGRGVEGSVREPGSESPAPAPGDPEPPRHCPKHPGGTDDPCRACGQARKSNETWQAEKRARAAAAPRCPRHPDQPAHNCGPCRSERLGGP